MAQRPVLPLVRQKQHRAVPDRPSPTGSTGTNQLSWLNWHRCGFNLENDRGPCQIEPAQLAQLARRSGGDFFMNQKPRSPIESKWGEGQ